MLERQITYENPFTNEEVTETHYFHISKADLVEMEIEEHGQSYEKDGQELTGMQAKLQRIVDSEDGKAIMAEFKDIIRRSYGRKEGDRFVRTDAAWQDFSGTEAFSQLLWELCTNPGSAAEFVNGVVPHNLAQIAQEVQEQAEKVIKGREAQDAARASAASPGEVTPETALADAADEAKEAGLDTSAVDNSPARQREIANATAENPVTLTETEMREMDSDEFKSGLATRRYKLS